MSQKYMMLNMELGALRNFLDRVAEESEAELKEIYQRNEEGEFQDFTDLESALNDPRARQRIAARAVYYEINALVESQLYAYAWKPWLDSPKYPGPKSLADKSLKDIQSLKMIWDLPFKKIVELVETSYSFKLNDLAGASAFWEIREAVNAFKHRQSLVDPRKQHSDTLEIGVRHEATIKKAYDYLDQTKIFINALWAATR